MAIWRIRKVEAETGLSSATIDRLEAKGEFPKRFKITPTGRSVGWLDEDVRKWIRKTARGEK